MGNHSVIPPSSAYIWGAPGGCRAWATLNQEYYQPKEQTEAAREGTAAHEVAEGYVRAAANPTVRVMKEGDITSNGLVVDATMVEAAQLYAGDVTEVMTRLRNFDPLVEHQIEAPMVHELSHGTEDSALIDAPTKSAYFWDFKYGRKLVEAFENLQMVNYAAGHIGEIGDPTDWTFHFTIVQPRGYHMDGPVRKWTLKWAELRSLIRQLRIAAEESVRGDGDATSGTHCRYCNARHACPAAQQAGVQLFEAVSEGFGVNMSPEAMALEYEITGRALSHLTSLMAAYEEQLMVTLRSGKQVMGWGLKEGRGSTKWTADTETIKLMGETMGVSLVTDKPITPLQAIKAGLPESVVEEMSERTPGALKLSKIDKNFYKRIFTNE